MRAWCLSMLVAACVVVGVSPVRAIEFPGRQPGAAVGRFEQDRLVLANDVLSVAWQIAPDRMRLAEIVDRMSGRTLRPAGDAFRVLLPDGRTWTASQMRREGNVSLEAIAAEPDAVRQADRCAGKRAVLSMVSPDGALRVRWQASIRDGANCVVQEVSLEAAKAETAVQEVVLFDLAAPDARAVGEVDGSPVVVGDVFLAVEHPTADNRVEQGRAVGSARVLRPLRPAKPWSRTAAIGVVPAGQLRRGFLYYVERRRMRPYAPFVHYNSWWDIAWGGRKMNEEECLTVIGLFGRELTEKRNVRLDSFCFDDGWDNNQTLWEFNHGFPKGFTPLKEEAAKYGSALGVWLSPWGGYGKEKEERLAYGRSQGFEINAKGFSLEGPKYRARYRDACVGMIEKYGVDFFKFDGVAQGIDSRGAGPFAADVESLLSLIMELRRHKPDLFVSNTTGTWPSPYWLWFGDSVWRNGADWGVQGAGTVRQQWITYRDMITYRMIARRAPLYPLNSLMIVAVCYAQHAKEMAHDVPDLVDEIHMGFAGGTQTLELYVTPQMMNQDAWDALAETIRWTRQNADVLVDSHWLGGDPGKAEPYGYASWSPRKGILALRNPSGKAVELPVDAAAFELPEGAPRRYRLHSAFGGGGQRELPVLEAGRAVAVPLRAWETLVLEAVPAEGSLQ